MQRLPTRCILSLVFALSAPRVATALKMDVSRHLKAAKAAREALHEASGVRQLAAELAALDAALCANLVCQTVAMHSAAADYAEDVDDDRETGDGAAEEQVNTPRKPCSSSSGVYPTDSDIRQDFHMAELEAGWEVHQARAQAWRLEERLLDRTSKAQYQDIMARWSAGEAAACCDKEKGAEERAAAEASGGPQVVTSLSQQSANPQGASPSQAQMYFGMRRAVGRALDEHQASKVPDPATQGGGQPAPFVSCAADGHPIYFSLFEAVRRALEEARDWPDLCDDSALSPRSRRTFAEFREARESLRQTRANLRAARGGDLLTGSVELSDGAAEAIQSAREWLRSGEGDGLDCGKCNVDIL